ncbi:hypothetical protein BVRB_2g037170 [Beta vulgaris subsp. vulgaris]|nr:hypothetical protein BVRB_2g037170 [Beta vulgaris subsp. vulgaris]
MHSRSSSSKIFHLKQRLIHSWNSNGKNGKKIVKFVLLTYWN